MVSVGLNAEANRKHEQRCDEGHPMGEMCLEARGHITSDQGAGVPGEANCWGDPAPCPVPALHSGRQPKCQDSLFSFVCSSFFCLSFLFGAQDESCRPLLRGQLCILQTQAALLSVLQLHEGPKLTAQVTEGCKAQNHTEILYVKCFQQPKAGRSTPPAGATLPLPETIQASRECVVS